MPQLIRFARHMSTHVAENLEKFSRADEKLDLAFEIFHAIGHKTWEVYSLAFMTDFEEESYYFPNSDKGWSVLLAFVMMTIFVNIVMLNILIAIVGEGYTQVSARMREETYKQTAVSIVELEATYLQWWLKAREKEGGTFLELKYNKKNRLMVDRQHPQ